MNRYSKYLGPKLKDVVEAFQQSEDKQDQLRIFDEIAMARGLLTEQLTLASAALGTEGVNDQTRLLAIDIMRTGINAVADLCAKAAQIEKNLADKISLDTVNLIMRQVLTVVQEETRELPQLAERLLARISNDVLLPKDAERQDNVIVKVDYE